MIEVGKLYELNGKATQYTAPMTYGSGSWGTITGQAANTVKISTNTYHGYTTSTTL